MLVLLNGGHAPAFKVIGGFDAPLADACVTEWRTTSVAAIFRIAKRHSLMLVLLNGGSHWVKSMLAPVLRHSLMLVLLNGGAAICRNLPQSAARHSLMLVLLNGGTIQHHEQHTHTSATR